MMKDYNNDASWLTENAWGKWGEDDEVGALNDVTPADVVKAASLIRTGKVYDLETVRFKGMPVWDGHIGFELLTYGSPMGRRNMSKNSDYSPAFAWHKDGGWVASANDDYQIDANTEVMIAPMHMGTHIDGFCHITVGEDAHWYNGYNVSEYWGDFGPLKTDATTIPPIILRGVLLDIAGYKGLDHVDPNYGITPEDIGGCKLGALGIPEFGTDFAMQMLIDTKPQAFSDLVRIAGLSHGTDVWLGNAQTLIQEGKATISTAICTRDDIMTYLIGKGLDSEEVFTIMERVRKGAVANGKCKEWPEYKKDMLDHGVPDWYVWSCEKIKYMFPKAHAAAYVMMAWRIAWCKVFYPLAYYAAFFSIRATSFNYELMCQGKERLEYFMHDYERRKDTLSKKEQDTYKDMRIVQEMYARGFEFLPIDLYKAKAHHFQIIDNKLMPSISTIDGLGDKAADAVVEAAKDGKFLSRDDFRQRTKVSKTVIDLMVDLGILADLPESNQLSLFDL